MEKPSPERIEMLVALCHRRWSLPLLARFAEGSGRRFVELQRALGASAQPLRDNLDGLIELGLVARHGGHGHPLRPEYVPTQEGRHLARNCAVLMREIEARDLADLAARKWSLPVLAVLAAGAVRYGEIRASLPGLGPRALALALRELEKAGLVRREVEDGHPPGVSYGLERSGRRLARKLGALLGPPRVSRSGSK